LSDFAIAMLVKPLVLLALFVPAALLGRWVIRRIPEGRVKRLLSSRIGP
jgi:hypothetical protein